jgi:signal transduction histidine kinase
MEIESDKTQQEQILGNQKLMTELLLVKPWVTKEDVVRQGLANTSDTAEAVLESLRSRDIIQKESRGYTCSLEKLEWIAELLPPKDDSDTLRRAMRKNFQPAIQDSMIRSTWEAFNEPTVSRPNWYFDLTAIIHPALTIDSDLNITGCSNALCDFVLPMYPDLREQVKACNLKLATFLQELEIYHFDYETLEPSNVHALDPTEKFSGLLKDLADHGSVDKKPVLFRRGKIEHYLELSFALQVAFPGAQSIWHIVDQRVGQMRLIRAMRLTKWFITAHRLKQPTNLFNVARATLTLLSRNLQNVDLTRQDIQTELTEVIDSLSAGIAEFSRFVYEISQDEYKLSTKLEEVESVDVLSVIEDVVTDIDFIYAKPSGVSITMENCAPKDDTRRFIRANPFLLREAFFNIIHNAFKHGRKKSEASGNLEIHIRCTCLNPGLVIEIEDSGLGMSNHEIEEYDKVFQEINTSVNPAEVGALSGLSLALSVIKNSNGQIFFKNLTPNGFKTTVTFDEC